jgi:acetamidase/formamidase
MASHDLPATPETCFWGYFDRDEPPVLEVAPGDLVRVEALTHHAGDAPDLMMDDGVRAVWDAIAVEDRGPGVHVMTGPIAVAGARPGGAVAVTVTDMAPRLAYGATAAANWGALHDVFGEEWITIWEVAADDPERAEAIVRPAFRFDFVGRPVYDQPGFLSDPATVDRQPFSRAVAVPVRPHFGVLGVAPGRAGRVSSIPPDVYGGNVDNWRLGAGATMHLPVFVEGANVFVGDPHMAQGDGEVCGTAVECSLNAGLRIDLSELPIDAPVLETDTHWFTHGFDEDLDLAMRASVLRMLELVGHLYGLGRKEAYSLLSVGADLGVTQVVDGNKGCHVGIAKALFV